MYLERVSLEFVSFYYYRRYLIIFYFGMSLVLMFVRFLFLINKFINLEILCINIFIFKNA